MIFATVYKGNIIKNLIMDCQSLDCDDGIEYSACLHEPTPQELLDRMELFVHLWNALNSLPEVQGVRVRRI